MVHAAWWARATHMTAVQLGALSGLRWWKKDDPVSPELFHRQAEREVAEWRRCVAQKGRAACIRTYKPQQLVKGMYHDFLEVREACIMRRRVACVAQERARCNRLLPLW